MAGSFRASYRALYNVRTTPQGLLFLQKISNEAANYFDSVIAFAEQFLSFAELKDQIPFLKIRAGFLR